MLRKRTADVGVVTLLRGRLDDKDDVVLRFEGGDDRSVAGLVGYGLFVDGRDDGAFAEADFVGEGAGTDVGDDDAALDASLRGDLRRDGGDGDAELALSGVRLLRGCVVVLLIAGDVGVGFGAVADDDVGGLLFAVAEEAEFDRGAYVAGRDVGNEIVAVLDVASVDGDDDVAGLDAGLGRAAAGSDDADDNAAGEAVDTAYRGGLSGLELDADGAANHLMFRPDEHVVDRGDDVGGHGETDALGAHGLGVDGGVHADDFACHVDQRTAGVAGVDGGVGLDEALELTVGDAVGAGLVDGAVLGGDDAGGDGLREGEGAADGENPVADLGAVGVAEFNGREGLFGVDLDDGDVGVFIDADDGGGTAWIGGIVGVAGKLDVDLVGFVDDVIVGDDVAVGVDDEAGAESAALAAVATVVVTLAAALTAEEAVEEVLHVAGGLGLVVVVSTTVALRLMRGAATPARLDGGLLGQLFGVDVDDRGADLFDDLREAVGERDGRRNNDGLRVGGVDAGLLFAADAARENGTGHDAYRKGGKKHEGRGETTGADALKQGGWSVRRCVHG